MARGTVLKRGIYRGRRTSLGMAFVDLFAPSLSAAEVVLSVMPGTDEACEAPVI